MGTLGSFVTLFRVAFSFLRTVAVTTGTYLLASRTHKLKKAEKDLDDVREAKEIAERIDRMSADTKRKLLRKFTKGVK